VTGVVANPTCVHRDPCMDAGCRILEPVGATAGSTLNQKQGQRSIGGGLPNGSRNWRGRRDFCSQSGRGWS